MHVMAATRRGQGDLEGDFSFTVEGELVTLPVDVCVDPECGCERAVTGLASAKGTTTFTILDLPDLTKDRYAELVLDGLTEHGWITTESDRAAWRHFVDWHIDVASCLPLGGLLRMNAATKTIVCVDSGPSASESC
jgi:hypothetical protein